VTDLTRHGTDVTSVFDLLGRYENDLTASLGFVLSRCQSLCAAVLRRIWREASGTSQPEVAFALEVRDRDGRTDLEVRLDEALLIIEAKRGWLLPSPARVVSLLLPCTRRRQVCGATVHGRAGAPPTITPSCATHR
jgi:hypothetical protein